MQDALTGASVFMLARQEGQGDIPTEDPLPMFCQPEDPRAASGFCKEGQPGALGYVAINLPRDVDGFVRQANMFYGGAVPSEGFALKLAEQYTGEPVKAVDHERFSFMGKTLYYSNPEEKEILVGSLGAGAGVDGIGVEGA